MKRILLAILLILSIAAFANTNTNTTIKVRSKRSAMNWYRVRFPTCAVCDAKRSVNGNKCEVHHIQPESFRPDLVDDTNNFVTLCRRHHFWIGHMRNFKTANTNLLATIEAVRAAYTNTAMRGTK